METTIPRTNLRLNRHPQWNAGALSIYIIRACSSREQAELPGLRVPSGIAGPARAPHGDEPRPRECQATQRDNESVRKGVRNEADIRLLGSCEPWAHRRTMSHTNPEPPRGGSAASAGPPKDAPRCAVCIAIAAFPGGAPADQILQTKALLVPGKTPRIKQSGLIAGRLNSSGSGSDIA